MTSWVSEPLLIVVFFAGIPDPPARLGLPMARQGIGLIDDHHVAIDAWSMTVPPSARQSPRCGTAFGSSSAASRPVHVHCPRNAFWYNGTAKRPIAIAGH